VDEKDKKKRVRKAATKSFGSVILQIILIDLVFSFDSILTAVGMTNGVPGALYIMITAVIISVLIMMQFAVPVGNFVNTHPSIQY
jgi:predicted tellurium resistance membrane protein TerC